MVSLPLSPDSKTNDSPIKIMFMGKDFFSSFLPNGVGVTDPQKSVQCTLTLSRSSREGVDELMAKAKEAGGKTGIRGKTDLEMKMEEKGIYGDA